MISALEFKARMDPHLLTSSPTCNGFLRFTSGATPADLLKASTEDKAEMFGYRLQPEIQFIKVCSFWAELAVT